MSAHSAAPPQADVVDLTVPPVDVIADLHGNPTAADLILFVNGNQFMVMDDAVEAFRREQREVREVFFETIPPGKLLEQARDRTLQIGRLRLSIKPDAVAAGPGLLAPLHEDGLIEQPVVYASNDLAILVAKGNPKSIRGLADLARPEVRVAMPNLRYEGVAELIGQALEKAGGPQLRRSVLEEKAASGHTRWTDIHHRESALWLAAGEVDACPLWSTEALYHVELGAEMETVTIPTEHNVTGTYAIAVMRGCAHPAAAQAYVDFLSGPSGREVYARYGFSGPEV